MSKTSDKIIAVYVKQYPFFVRAINLKQIEEARQWCTKRCPGQWAYYATIEDRPVVKPIGARPLSKHNVLTYFFFKEDEDAMWFSLKWL